MPEFLAGQSEIPTVELPLPGTSRLGLRTTKASRTARTIDDAKRRVLRPSIPTLSSTTASEGLTKFRCLVCKRPAYRARQRLRQHQRRASRLSSRFGSKQKRCVEWRVRVEVSIPVCTSTLYGKLSSKSMAGTRCAPTRWCEPLWSSAHISAGRQNWRRAVSRILWMIPIPKWVSATCSAI